MMNSIRKNLRFVIMCIVVVFALMALTIANGVHADETPPAKKDRTYVIDPSKPGEKVVVPVPGPGENVNIVIKRPKPVVNVYNEGNNLELRGGFSVGFGFPARLHPSLTFGLIGRIGYTDSPWVLDTTFQVGVCMHGMALNGGLAGLRSLSEHFRLGVGADMLYCSNVSDYNIEKAEERVVGGSFHFQFEDGRFILAGNIGLGAATWPVPGDRKTGVVGYGGVVLSYLL